MWSGCDIPVTLPWGVVARCAGCGGSDHVPRQTGQDPQDALSMEGGTGLGNGVFYQESGKAVGPPVVPDKEAPINSLGEDEASTAVGS